MPKSLSRRRTAASLAGPAGCRFPVEGRESAGPGRRPGLPAAGTARRLRVFAQGLAASEGRGLSALRGLVLGPARRQDGFRRAPERRRDPGARGGRGDGPSAADRSQIPGLCTRFPTPAPFPAFARIEAMQLQKVLSRIATLAKVRVRPRGFVSLCAKLNV